MFSELPLLHWSQEEVGHILIGVEFLIQFDCGPSRFNNQVHRSQLLPVTRMTGDQPVNDRVPRREILVFQKKPFSEKRESTASSNF